MVENLLCTKIVTLRSNSGGEFLSTQFSKFLRDSGIIHQLRCPHTPEQNGCAERKHRHLVETARTLLAASKVPHEFWVDAFATTIYLINRLPTAQHCSPWESLFHKPPEYTSLKIFGCKCFPWLKPYVNSKLEPKSQPCVFLGYSLQHKGYKCMDLVTRKVYISRHVLFYETQFPFHHISSSSNLMPMSQPSHFNHIPTSLTFSTPPTVSTISSSSSILPFSPPLQYLFIHTPQHFIPIQPTTQPTIHISHIQTNQSNQPIFTLCKPDQNLEL